ncbi:class I SAM-dependent DNA methyltransferase [Amycolatopsis sp. NPDC098790]|uniref:class I SAM-dependent DNA methyltransferase n=1 Tax=Amycolatopsis sp. NPDC098790 TaxID=3363939 RepID=UPI003816176B
MPFHDPEFYDDLADTYHRMYEDWWGFAVRYAEPIAAALAGAGVEPPAEVLDCTCGIGTQALPLATTGYRVTGSDLSGRAIERAGREAATRGLDVHLVTSDVRRIDEQFERTFDAVISGANSLTHLLTDQDLRRALRAVRRCLRPAGVFVATIRDYDEVLRDEAPGLLPELFGKGDDRSVITQAWEWAEDRRTLTTIHILTIKRRGRPGWDTTVRTTDYRVLRRAEFDAALSATGFGDIRWRFPEETGHYQPMVVARVNPEWTEEIVRA